MECEFTRSGRRRCVRAGHRLICEPFHARARGDRSLCQETAENVPLNPGSCMTCPAFPVCISAGICLCQVPLTCPRGQPCGSWKAKYDSRPESQMSLQSCEPRALPAQQGECWRSRVPISVGDSSGQSQMAALPAFWKLQGVVGTVMDGIIEQQMEHHRIRDRVSFRGVRCILNDPVRLVPDAGERLPFPQGRGFPCTRACATRGFAGPHLEEGAPVQCWLRPTCTHAPTPLPSTPLHLSPMGVLCVWPA